MSYRIVNVDKWTGEVIDDEPIIDAEYDDIVLKTDEIAGLPVDPDRDDREDDEIAQPIAGPAPERSAAKFEALQTSILAAHGFADVPASERDDLIAFVASAVEKRELAQADPGGERESAARDSFNVQLLELFVERREAMGDV